MKHKLPKEMFLISRMGHFRQCLSIPLKVIFYVFFTRISKFLKQTYLLKTKTFWGDTIIGYSSDPNFSFLYLYGFIDEGLTVMIDKYVRPGMVCIDVGAHIGYETLLMQRLTEKKGMVISFEPTPATFNLLNMNVLKKDNVILNNIAVWSDAKILRLYDYGSGNSGLNGFFKPRISHKNIKTSSLINIGSESLDNYCGKYNISPDFVKIDAESAEYNILYGMQRLLKVKKPVIIMEIGDLPSEKGRTLKCLSYLLKYGYKIYEYTNGNITPHKIKKEYINVYDNLLFLNENETKK